MLLVLLVMFMLLVLLVLLILLLLLVLLMLVVSAHGSRFQCSLKVDSSRQCFSTEKIN